ncbi:MAG: metal-dependent hydrolase [Desulfococcaceae bacterium]
MAAPVLAAGSINLIRIKSGRERLFSNREMMYTGLCGGLPDILSPHIRLAGRMSSLTHTLWFLLAAFIFLGILCFAFPGRFRFRCGLMCGAAIAMHLLADAVSGGIALFFPLDTLGIGHYYIPPVMWFPLDVAAVSLTLAVLSFSNLMERQMNRTE